MTERTLLDVIDTLTKPRIEHIAQRTDTGHWIRAVSVEHPPLLQQLAEARSGRTSPGSNKAAHERAPIDMDAAYLYAQYTAQISDWCRMIGTRPTRDPITDLRAWYATTLHIRDFDGTWYRRILTGWEHTIRTHFDPPRKFEAEQPCPVCGGTTWGDEFTGGAMHAIEVTYRLDDHGQPTGERALCRLCRTVWDGGDAVRELAEEMHEKRSAIG